jgi:endoglucanase
MDHPGFTIDPATFQIQFGGGVEERYFVGKQISFYSETGKKPLGKARITGTDFSEEKKLVRVDGDIPKTATFAMWTLPPARCTRKNFVSPACDDLVQVATVLALLRRLAAEDARARVHALFTRAEEVGFAGAFAALKSRTRLEPMPTLSLETSQARGFARMHRGPIVRVGDRLSTFTSQTTHWLETAFRDLAIRKPGTIYQRLLMGGGTCEASVFQRAGLPTGALCVGLTNYHNRGAGSAIRAESVSLSDWQGLYAFLHFLATEAMSPEAADAEVLARFDRLEAKAMRAFSGQNGKPLGECD